MTAFRKRLASVWWTLYAFGSLGGLGWLAYFGVASILVMLRLIGTQREIVVTECHTAGRGSEVCTGVWQDAAGREHVVGADGPVGNTHHVQVWHGISSDDGLLASLIFGLVFVAVVVPALIVRFKTRKRRLVEAESAWWPAVPGAAEALLLDAIDVDHPGAGRLPKRAALAFTRREWALRHTLPTCVVLRMDGQLPPGFAGSYDLPWPVDLGVGATRRRLHREARDAGVAGLGGSTRDEKARWRRAANARAALRREQRRPTQAGLSEPPAYPAARDDTGVLPPR